MHETKVKRLQMEMIKIATFSVMNTHIGLLPHVYGGYHICKNTFSIHHKPNNTNNLSWKEWPHHWQQKVNESYLNEDVVKKDLIFKIYMLNQYKYNSVFFFITNDY